METTRLRDPAFWASAKPEAPGSPFEIPELSDRRLDGLVFFQTSGSMGQPSWVGLTREALLHSAAFVNAHLKVHEGSCWGLALPLSHVGGFGVVARAFESGCRFSSFEGKWDPQRFNSWLGFEHVTHVSLVPTQVHDLVRASLSPPSTLEVVVVGGGVLDDESGRQARELGWRVVASYGMTETGSQIATQSIEILDEAYDGSRIEILPHWDVRIADDGRIAVRGAALFSGVLIRDGSGWRFDAREGGWFVTSDLGELEDDRLVVTGRADAQVKILGELVDPLAVERELALPEVSVISLRDPRNGNRLVAVYEDSQSDKRVSSRVEAYNCEAVGFRRIDRVVCIKVIPRSDLGKVRRVELARLLEQLNI